MAGGPAFGLGSPARVAAVIPIAKELINDTKIHFFVRWNMN
jgi:hypothetical protein